MTSMTIPLEAVQLSDGGESVSPGKGDSVSFTVEGSVESIGEGVASIQVTSANGVDLGAPATVEDTSTPEEMGDEDMDAAKAEFLASLEGQEL